MSNETTQSVFTDGSIEDVESNEYLKFGTDNTLTYKMLVSEPEVSVNKFGSPQWTFEILNQSKDSMGYNTVMNHSITSKRYMRSLGDYTPLEGKSFCIHRTGEGMDTNYQVVLLE